MTEDVRTLTTVFDVTVPTNGRQDRPTLLHGLVTAAFVATWIVLAVVGFLGSRTMDAAAKRRWMPRWIILIGVLFVFFSTTLTVLSSRSWSSLGILFLVVPAVS